MNLVIFVLLMVCFINELHFRDLVKWTKIKKLKLEKKKF